MLCRFRIFLCVTVVALSCVSLMMGPRPIEAQEAARKAPSSTAETPFWSSRPFERLLRKPPREGSPIVGDPKTIQSESRDVLFRGGGGENGIAIIPATDDGFFVVGQTTPLPAQIAWIMRVDSNLNRLWEKFYGDNRFVENARGAAGGGVIIVGYSLDQTSTLAWASMLDKEGAPVWERVISSEPGSKPTSVVALSDSVVVTGYDREKGWIRCLDNATGQEVWAIVPNAPAGNALSNYMLAPTAISTLPDGTTMVAGLAVKKSDTVPGNRVLAWFGKIDSAGQVIMGPVAVESQYELFFLMDVVALSDGDLALTGFGFEPNAPTSWLARVSAQGVLRWQATEEGGAVRAVALPEGHFIAVVSSERMGTQFKRHGASATPVAVARRGGPPAGFAGTYPIGMARDALLHKGPGRNRLIGVGVIEDPAVGNGLWLFSLPAIELGIE